MPNLPEPHAAEDLAQAGVEAERAGIPWYRNPYRSGSVEAYEWDRGHSAARRIRRAQTGAYV